MTITPDLPVHFLTIVHNGEPFIRYHINVLNQLPFQWHWHVVEGVAELRHDTAWALANGGSVPEACHENGLSNDGTTHYLDRLSALFPDNVSVYRPELGKMWEGKREMITAPLKYISEESLLWQIDVDEFWTADQLCSGRELFLRNTEKTAAWYDCHFFVGPNLVVDDTKADGHRLSTNWLRTWRYTPGCRWESHEPPVLVKSGENGAPRDIGRENPFLPVETRHEGLVFQHKAYILQKQLRFKEVYYGYRGATMNWLLLQKQRDFPLQLKEFFPWPFVANGTQVIRDIQAGVHALPLPEEGEHVLETPQDLNLLSRFINRMALDAYPETPSLTHSETTNKALATLEELFPLLPGMRVLDVGCGQGPALEHFSSRKLEYLGITLSEDDIAECRAKGYRVEKMDQSFLTLPEGSQDLVWARHVIEHSLFPLFTLGGFSRILRPGGFLYLEVPAPETSCHHERNPNHYSVLSKGCWRALLERCGFRIFGDVDYSFEVPAGPDMYWGFYCRKN
ncbi:MAG: class I SAM-dependent methyltransferase [Desulfuromonadales bacterium]